MNLSMKHMKFFVTLLVTFFLLAPVAQAQDDELEFAVKALNEECPMSLGSGITLQNVQIEDLAVVYVCVVDEDIVSMDQIEASRDAIQSGLEEYMAEASQDLDVQEFVKYCKNVEKDVIYRYVGSSSGKVADFFIEL